MKSKLLIFFMISCSLWGCSTYKSTLKNEAEKVVIYICAGGNSDEENSVTVEISDKKEIGKIINYTTKMISPGYKCGYDGKIEYYCAGNNVIMDMEFNVSCNTMVFVYGDRLFTRRISKEGLLYFKSLKENALEEDRGAVIP